MISAGILAAFASVALWATSNLIVKTVARGLGRFETSAVSLSAATIPLVVLFLLSPTALGTYYMLVSVAAGIFVIIGYLLYYRSMESQQVSNVASINLFQTAVLAVFGIVFLAEPINALEIGGAFIVFAGVILISTRKGGRINQKLIPASLANISWAVYWILISIVIHSTGQFVLPLLIAFMTAAAIAIIYVVFLSEEHMIRHSTHTRFPLAVLVGFGIVNGILSSSGNIAFGIAISYHFLAIGSIITALSPVIVAFCAHFIYRERLTGIQTVGLVAAVAGAILVAVF